MHRVIVRSFCHKRHVQSYPSICTRNVSDWKEEHATDSEAIVKADRHDNQQTIKELQDHTIDKIKNKYYDTHDL